MTKEAVLPKSVLDLASLRGKEFAWRPNDVSKVFEAARFSNLAINGGQLQFRLPKAICEPYWIWFESEPKGDKESWADYVLRSSEECAAQFADLCKKHDFVRLGIENFSLLKTMYETGDDIEKYICFVIYINDELTYIQNKKSALYRDILQRYHRGEHRWNQIVSSFPTPHFLQTYEWAQVKVKYGWEPNFLVWSGKSDQVYESYRSDQLDQLGLLDQSDIRAACLVLKRTAASRFSILYAPKGPLMDWSKPLRSNVPATDKLPVPGPFGMRLAAPIRNVPRVMVVSPA